MVKYDGRYCYVDAPLSLEIGKAAVEVPSGRNTSQIPKRRIIICTSVYNLQQDPQRMTPLLAIPFVRETGGSNSSDKSCT
jgi:hypothetical protein